LGYYGVGVAGAKAIAIAFCVSDMHYMRLIYSFLCKANVLLL